MHITTNQLLDRLYKASHTDSCLLGTTVADDVSWQVAHPVNLAAGREALVRDWLEPLRASLPDLERRALIALESGDGSGWAAGTGFFVGTFSKPFFGIPASGRTLYLRYTELVRSANGLIVECYLIPDFLDAMLQVDVYPLRPSLGHTGLIPAPFTQDGLLPHSSDVARNNSTEKLVMDMLDELRAYDGVSLESMDLARFWHPDFMWYGPAAIGTTRGIEGFRAHHQGPFLEGFPDRDVDHHACTVACGDYVATGGWPHMHATHSGGGWLGLPPSGVHLELRVMDIWRRDGDLLVENWVAIDICHMLQQMGLDVFAQMRTLIGGSTYG
ncbi:MAG: ester cyclase [Pseudomonadota bacterium]